jgi:rhodanese-related sulfurtransferase
MKTFLFAAACCCLVTHTPTEAAQHGYHHTAAVPTAHAYEEISTEELQALLEQQVVMLLLDARTDKYDDGQRIPGAQRLPHNTPAEQILAAIPLKDTLLVVYCTGVDCPASRFLAEKLVKLGYTNVKKYPAGVEGWIAAGLPVIQE